MDFRILKNKTKTYLCADLEGLHDFITTREEKVKSKEWRVYMNSERLRAQGSEWTFGDGSITPDMMRDRLLTREPNELMVGMAKEWAERMKDAPEIQKYRKEMLGKKKRIYAESGDELDIDRLMSGQEHWQSRYKTPKKVVKIHVNFFMSCGNEPEDFACLISGAFVVLELLEEAGYAVELYGMMRANLSAEGKHKAHVICVKFPMKRATELTTIEHIACLSYPGLLRYYGFDYMENLIDSPDPGMGRATDNQEFYDFMGIENVIERAWHEDSQVFDFIKNIVVE